nr:MAG TPA: hypothetical protein [Caudoviricetes sp.]
MTQICAGLVDSPRFQSRGICRREAFAFTPAPSPTINKKDIHAPLPVPSRAGSSSERGRLNVFSFFRRRHEALYLLP